MEQKIIFNDGTEYPILSAKGEPRMVGDALRNVLTIAVTGAYADVLATAQSGEGFAIHQGEDVFDKPNYTVLLSVTNRLDGTCAFEITTPATVEQEQAGTIAEQQATIAEQADMLAQMAENTTSNTDLEQAMQEGVDAV